MALFKDFFKMMTKKDWDRRDIPSEHRDESVYTYVPETRPRKALRAEERTATREEHEQKERDVMVNGEISQSSREIEWW
jgi:hypothetical protein